MGKLAKLNRETFFKTHPICIFCGGNTRANTKEHCPPKALFERRVWPNGFEFAACANCNNGTSGDDVVVALLGRFGREHLKLQDGRTIGVMRNANNQHPEMFPKMLDITPIQARKTAKELGVTRPPGLTYQQSGIVNVTPHMDTAVATLAKKLSKAIFYKETNKIFPANGEIQFNWFTNANLLKLGFIPALQAFANIEAKTPSISRNGRDLKDQFNYRFSLSSDHELAVLQAVFGSVFGFLTIMSAKPGVLARIDSELQAANPDKSNPFRFLQP